MAGDKQPGGMTADEWLEGLKREECSTPEKLRIAEAMGFNPFWVGKSLGVSPSYVKRVLGRRSQRGRPRRSQAVDPVEAIARWLEERKEYGDRETARDIRAGVWQKYL